ncbi:unnamed protein product [Merluccius merluccius]
MDQWRNPGVAAVMATPPADLPVPVTMDTSELDSSLMAPVTDHDPRAEPMEQHSQSEEQGPTPGERDQNAGVVENTILRNQILQSRKRVYHLSLERTGDRKIEAVRRVHFSEEVVAIAPVALDISMGADSEEEDSQQQEEISVPEEEDRAGPGPLEGAGEVADTPPRPPVLPAWIRALKRKSGGKPKR